MLCMSGSIQTKSEDILPKAAQQESEEVPVVFQTEDGQEVCSQCATMNNILISLVMCKHLSTSYKVALDLNSNHMLVKCVSINVCLAVPFHTSHCKPSSKSSHKTCC